MNLLQRAVIAFRRWASVEAAFTLGVVGALLAVEVLGRQSPSDLHDLLAIGFLGMLATTIVARHRRTPLVWVSWLHAAVDAAGRSVRESTFQMGLDMRGSPPVKRGLPPLVKRLMIGLAIACVVLALVSPWFPDGIRPFAVRISYLTYLAVLIVYWLAATAASLLCLFVPMAMIHDSIVTRYRGPQPRSLRFEFFINVMYFAVIMLATLVLPLWIAMGLIAGLTLYFLVGIFTRPRVDVQFLWRPHGSIQVRSMTWGQWLSCEIVTIGLAMLTLSLAGAGRRLYPITAEADVMRVTGMNGTFMAWLGAALLSLLFVYVQLARRRDPSRSSMPSLFVKGELNSANRRILSKRGWQVSAERKPLDVSIEFVSKPEQREQEWPLQVTAADLEREGLYVRLARRDDVQKRRRFFHVLETLLKAARQRDRGGSGFWIAPHFWFVAGLIRDGKDDEAHEFDFQTDPILSPVVGRPWHLALEQGVRHHLYRIMRATQIDLVFVEDGVKFSRLRKVLRLLFEVYDLSEGERPATEVDFRGIPKVKVAIHDYQFDEPYSSNDYPEPKFDFLGRARILHVFRDRGGDKERLSPPFDFTSRPAPAGAM